MPIRITPIARAFRALSLALVLNLTVLSIGQPLLSSATPMNSATLHQKLHSRGLGSSVRVTEVNGVVVRGTLVELEPDSFEVVPKQTVHPMRISNTQVARLDNVGLPKRAKQAIGILVGVVVVVSLAVIATSISLTRTPV
jgi:hypothetical protein